jgi:putative transposase
MPEKDNALREQILSTLVRHPAYGHRRLAIHLEEDKSRILRIMRKFRLAPTVPKRSRKPRKRGPHAYASFPNVAERMMPLYPDVIWVGDFTEFEIRPKRRVFLATVLDFYTREVIGWSIGLHHTALFVIEALEAAHRERGRSPLIYHSDQGSEYTSRDVIHWLLEHGIRPSMSPKGKPWKNGRQESFYGKFKGELGDPKAYPTIEDFYQAIADLIRYYNTERIHGKLKMTPEEFRMNHPRPAPPTWITLPKPSFPFD